MELMDMINAANQLKNVKIQLEYMIEGTNLIQYLLPGQPDEILVPDFSVETRGRGRFKSSTLS
jgi:hypothetical protein